MDFDDHPDVCTGIPFLRAAMICRERTVGEVLDQVRGNPVGGRECDITAMDILFDTYDWVAPDVSIFTSHADPERFGELMPIFNYTEEKAAEACIEPELYALSALRIPNSIETDDVRGETRFRDIRFRLEAMYLCAESLCPITVVVDHEKITNSLEFTSDFEALCQLIQFNLERESR